MAQIELNSLVKAIKGKLGKSLVIRQMRDGSLIISGKPDFSRRKFSKGQLTHQTRFQEAAAYARYAAKTQPIYAQLAKGTTKTAYNIALSDWFNPPIIHSAKLHRGTIHIEATDNVQIAKVLVKILDTDENVLEQGVALFTKDITWEYIPATLGKAVVQAWDLAGNVATKEILGISAN